MQQRLYFSWNKFPSADQMENLEQMFRNFILESFSFLQKEERTVVPKKIMKHFFQLMFLNRSWGRVHEKDISIADREIMVNTLLQTEFSQKLGKKYFLYYFKKRCFFRESALGLSFRH